jgi:hypothetical protein
MATILAFRPVEFRRHAHALATTAAQPAEVILFPGVRYERWKEDAGKDEAGTRTRDMRKRDVLELAE